MEHPKKNTPRAKYPPCSSFLARSGGRIWKPENSGRHDVFLFPLRFFFCRGDVFHDPAEVSALVTEKRTAKNSPYEADRKGRQPPAKRKGRGKSVFF